ncbi:hypothetical protein AVEN_25739-1 [Araneus ventricosus]|uniref:Uncharacterized protein n=1 Tax=Araneus ventricosus TaxID=182803 RepID=A0A4Y2Q3V7_ARAVE|nr:hypothetical protein AVEN_25739-1 [Araneus ventricosus]
MARRASIVSFPPFVVEHSACAVQNPARLFLPSFKLLRSESHRRCPILLQQFCKRAIRIRLWRTWGILGWRGFGPSGSESSRKYCLIVSVQKWFRQRFISASDIG